MKFDITNAPLPKFNDTVLSVLDKHAPKKKKKKERKEKEKYMFKQLEFYD